MDQLILKGNAMKFKKFYAYVLLFFMHANGYSNVDIILENYDPRLYNALPEVEVADRQLKNSYGFEEFMEEA
jgi:hypothetical protein